MIEYYCDHCRRSVSKQDVLKVTEKESVSSFWFKKSSYKKHYVFCPSCYNIFVKEQQKFISNILNS